MGRSGELGKRLTNLASDFDPRTFGSRKLSDLVRKTNSFEIEPKAEHGSISRGRIAAEDANRSKICARAGGEICPSSDRNERHHKPSMINGMAQARF